MGKGHWIDLGTTNSCVAVMDGKTAKVIENCRGHAATPSIVAFSDDGERLVGQPAKRQAVTNPERTFFAVQAPRRPPLWMIRHGEKDKSCPYKIVKASPTAMPGSRPTARPYSPSQISAFILQKMKGPPSPFSAKKVDQAVITVSRLIQTTRSVRPPKDDRQDCRLEVLRIINDHRGSTCLRPRQDESRTIAVTTSARHLRHFDSGNRRRRVRGEVDPTATPSSAVKTSNMRLVSYLADEFQKEQGITCATTSLPAAPERGRRKGQDRIVLDHADRNQTALHHRRSIRPSIDMKLTRAKFEALVDDLIQRPSSPARKALKDAGLTAGEIGEVVLVGGMTRMPKVQEMVKQLFGKEPAQGRQPRRSRRHCAAIQAGVLQGDVKDVLLLDVTPLFSASRRWVACSPASSIAHTIPTKKSQVFSTAEDNQNAVHHSASSRREREMGPTTRLWAS